MKLMRRTNQDEQMLAPVLHVDEGHCSKKMFAVLKVQGTPPLLVLCNAVIDASGLMKSTLIRDHI